ncbi:transposase [Paraburkholderia hospita]
MDEHNYIPHVVDRRKEADLKRRDPKKKARRWVVEVCHSWFNRFRKLLVRYEKLERSFVALNHLAAPIIAFRKVPLDVNIIYGYALKVSYMTALAAKALCRLGCGGRGRVRPGTNRMTFSAK